MAEASKSLAKIIDENDLAFHVKADEFLAVVNMPPPKPFVKDHPLAKGVKYIPIDKVELMLDKIFQYWRVEILSKSIMLNAIEVTVRVHYKHPISQEWLYQDGVGAVAIQVDKDKDASELKYIKSNAIMLGLPSAKSYAIKDACDHIGKIFGRDLNRKDTMAFTASYGTDEVKADIEAKKAEIKDKLNEELKNAN